MCGIVGVWEPGARDGLAREASVRRAMGALRHRGPDSEGIWGSAKDGVTFGHTRLAVIDLSPRGHQPMLSADGRYVITFNGEIYNFQEIRAQLRSHGVRFESQSDTEVLLEGYALWGDAVLDRLVGQFAFAIWDEQSHRLFLARDRLGEKPLYYSRIKNGIAFASELKALLYMPGVDLALAQDAVGLYLEHQNVPAPHTIYARIKKLPAAHSLTLTATSSELRRYWDPLPFALAPRQDITEPEALEQLDYLLRRAVSQQLVSDVRLGAFLSGGIDSTSVVAMMTELADKQVKTFTIGFDVPEFSEAKHAAAVAEHLGTDHTCEYLTLSAARDLIPSLPSLYGEPFADYSALPTQLVSRVARAEVTVCLSGDAGDELFGGYQRYDQLELFLGVSRFAGPVPALVSPVLRRAPGRMGRLADHVVGGRERDPYRPLVSVFNAVEVMELTGCRKPTYEAFDRSWNGTVGSSPRRRAMATDLTTYLPDTILVKVDRAAMSTSLESRAPFLDHRLVEWSLGLPQELVKQKRVLKEFAYRHVPKRLLDRPKQGFGVPLSSWFRGELQDLMRDTLTPARLEPFGIGNSRAVSRLMDDHVAGRRDNGGKLWTLVALSLWRDRTH